MQVGLPDVGDGLGKGGVDFRNVVAVYLDNVPVECLDPCDVFRGVPSEIGGPLLAKSV